MDTMLVIIYKKDSDEVESITVTENREWGVEQFNKYMGRVTITNYRIGDTYKLSDESDNEN